MPMTFPKMLPIRQVFPDECLDDPIGEARKAVLASELGSRIGKVHVKDFDRGVGGSGGFRRLFQGSVEWADVRQALVNVGYDDYLPAEVANYATNPKASVCETARKIEMIITGDL